jgi:hypothetical protein
VSQRAKARRGARRHHHGRVDPTITVRAIRSAQRLDAADRGRQQELTREAMERLLRGGPDASACWRDMADVANVAEQLAELRIGSGPEADAVIADAQEALGYMHQERMARGTWALRAEERDLIVPRLELLVRLHELQLEVCSYGEFERAYQAVVRKVTQARAGNAPAGAIVLEGLVGLSEAGARSRDGAAEADLMP